MEEDNQPKPKRGFWRLGRRRTRLQFLHSIHTLTTATNDNNCASCSGTRKLKLSLFREFYLFGVEVPRPPLQSMDQLLPASVSGCGLASRMDLVKSWGFEGLLLNILCTEMTTVWVAYSG